MVDMDGSPASVSSNPWETMNPSSLTYDSHCGFPTNRGVPYGQRQVPSPLPISPSSTNSSLSMDSVTEGIERNQTPRATAHPVRRVGGLSQGLIARQVVLQQYETAKTNRILRERFHAGQQVDNIKNISLCKGFRNEKQAESSRAKKLPTPDDVRDPESMSGMKYQLHWDRERIARDKALRLLNGAYGNINVL